jgi:arylsulfotransferase ASST
VIVDFVAASFHPAPIGAYTTRGAYTFASAPDLHPPQLVADTPTVSSRLSPGYIFVTSFYDLTVHPMVGQSGPLVLDNRLQPVWFKPVPLNRVAANLSQQDYRGQPVLAWWQGVVTDTGATTFGEDVVVDRRYRTLATLKGAGGWILTLHALTIHGNDAWVSANRNIPRDLSRYGGTYNGALIDSAVQEYDLRTGRLLFTWDALKHIPLNDSHAIPPTNGFPWDAYHVNAVDLLDNGDFVVSMRNTWAAYLVDGRTGQIKWTLGGKHSSFSFGPGAAFEWQHDVQVYPNGAVTLFDDHCCQISGAGTFLSASKPSRGVELKLDTQGRRATLVAQYTHGANFDSEYMGNTEPLANGNMFVGWGSQPYLSEYSRDGQLLLDARFPHPDQSYRATLGSWVGLPTYPPAGAARRRAGATTVFASWNGATEVASWRVLAGSSTSDLHVVASRARAGFETSIPVSGGYGEFQVQALDTRGHTLGTSGAFAARSGR